MLIKTQTRFLGEIEVNTDTLDENVLAYLIRYGLRQSVDDAGADPKKGKAGSQERFKALLLGEVPSGGGARLGAFERAQRDVVIGYLRTIGVKVAEATKMATQDVEGAFKMFLAAKIATKSGVPVNLVPDEKVLANFARLWPDVNAKAQAIVDAARDTEGLDIDA